MAREFFLYWNSLKFLFLIAITTITGFGGMHLLGWVFVSTLTIILSLSLQLTLLFFYDWKVVGENLRELDVGKELKSLIDSILSTESTSSDKPDLKVVKDVEE